MQAGRRLMPALAIRNNSKHLLWRAPWLNQSQRDSLDSHPSASVAYLVLFFPMGSWAMDLLESKWIWVGPVFWFPFLWVLWFEIWNEVWTWWFVWDWAWILLVGRNLGGLCFHKRRRSGVVCGQSRLDSLFRSEQRLDCTFINQGFPWFLRELFSAGNLWDSSRTLLTTHVPTLVSFYGAQGKLFHGG